MAQFYDSDDVFLKPEEETCRERSKGKNGQGIFFKAELDDGEVIELDSYAMDESQSSKTTIKPQRGSFVESQLAEILNRHRDLALALTNVEDVSSEGSQTPDDHVCDRQEEAENSLEAEFVQVNPEDAIDPYTLCEDDENGSLISRLFGKIAEFGVEIMDALQEPNEESAEQEEQRTSLNLKELKKHSKRCSIAAQPYLETLAGMKDILLWKVPFSTFTIFCVYMYSLWKGWLASMLLFLILLQLILNYLSYKRGISLGLSLLPRREVEDLRLDTPGAQLVIDIAKIAQFVLQIVGDVLEKLKNLFTWERPETTMRFCVLIFSMFSLSLCISTSSLFTLAGTGIGIRLFVTTYLFHRFPKLRPKLDIIVWFLDRLPTKKALMRASRRKSSDLPEKRYSVASALHSFAEFGEIAAGSESQHSAFEAPKLIRKCVMIDKELSFPYTVSSGSFYVTDSTLIFKYKSKRKGQSEILKWSFEEVLAVKKVKVNKFTFVPIGGKALEIYVPGRGKPYILAGLIKRDDCYESIMSMGKLYGPKALFST